MSLTPRPISASDEVDQSRDVAGINKWAQSSRTIGFIMFVLGWFTIPAEVFLRRDFGQRWFTVVNFYAGFFMLLIFAIVQYLIGAVWGWVEGFIAHVASSINPLYRPEEPSFMDSVMDESMLFLLIAYLFMGSYHLFKIWWRKRTNADLHSFHDGTSRVEPLAKYVIKLVNGVAIPFVLFYRMLIPKKQRPDTPTPKLVNDVTAFTNTVFDPLVLLIFAYYMPGIASVWLFISAISLAIHANWKETAKLNKILDFKDSIIEARAMVQVHQTGQTLPASSTQVSQQRASPTPKKPEFISQVALRHADLSTIIDDLDMDKSHLNNLPFIL